MYMQGKLIQCDLQTFQRHNNCSPNHPSMEFHPVKHISECFIKPKQITQEQKQPLYLNQWDLAMLSANYIQKGLLFKKNPSMAGPDKEYHINTFLEKLKDSISIALIHFYPLAGRLKTLNQENPPSLSICIDCNGSPGARFIHAALDSTMEDILSPTDVPVVVQSFFDHDRAISHDGHTQSLLTVQVTELIDGIFIGVSINHVVADGTSYWHFFNVWSEIFTAGNNPELPISRPPVHKRWIPYGFGPILNLPFTHHSQFTSRHKAPILRERIFHLTGESVAELKARVNGECDSNRVVSSLQALSALLWRCITRARGIPSEQETGCRLAMNTRTRIRPALSPDYFGNYLLAVRGTTTAGDLLKHGIGFAATILSEAVANENDETVRNWVDSWIEKPFVYQPSRFFDPNSVMVGSSPRFDMYGNEFGMGKAMAIRSGYANKFDGKVTLYPGYEGGGSMDLEICLKPESMKVFEVDREFMDAVKLFDKMPQ